MEVKSNVDCSNIIHIAIVNDIDISSLENIRGYILERGRTDFEDERDALWCVFKQINLIIAKLYEPFGKDQKLRFVELKKLVSIWTIEIKIKRDADNEL